MLGDRDNYQMISLLVQLILMHIQDVWMRCCRLIELLRILDHGLDDLTHFSLFSQ
jgi:hypothetical protein